MAPGGTTKAVSLRAILSHLTVGNDPTVCQCQWLAGNDSAREGSGFRLPSSYE